MNDIKHKTCLSCDLRLPVENFYRDKTHKNGFKSLCKKCYLKRDAKRHKKHPFKKKARSAARKAIKAKDGNHLHHWSYNKEHYLDVIELSVKDHYRLHSHTKYDEPTKMYRDAKTNELLDSRDKVLNLCNELGIKIHS